MKKQINGLLWACVCGVMLLTGVSCEKMDLTDDDGEPRANVVLSIGSIEQVPFPVVTRATIEELCTHLCYHIYDDNGISEPALVWPVPSVGCSPSGERKRVPTFFLS